MIQWSSTISARSAALIKTVAVIGATVVAATHEWREAFALASAQALALLLGRLLSQLPWLEILLSIGALFVAPFEPVFVVVPLMVATIYLRNQTRVLGTTRANSREVMTQVLDLSSEGGLDPVVIARSLADELQRLTSCRGIAVTINARTLASAGDLSEITATYPLLMGDREFGSVTLSGGVSSPTTMAVIEEASTRLEAAVLFSEARSAAGAAERSRVARDMHDGVAQELTSLGYLIDDMLARAPEQTRPDLRSLRNELTRVISDLRLSIFELRSTTSEALSLGAALSDYVNQIRASVPFKIHLNIDEGTERLSEDVEEQLLRIVQEALANARRHSEAHNVWIACQIRAPRAVLSVDDDGVGLKDARTDSFGFRIMHERATQIGASVTVGNRVPSGVTVSIDLGD